VVLPINGHQPRTRPEGQKDSLAFLARLGDRVREARNMRGMSRRVLSDISGVSERYLAQLEGGSGNISIILLRDIALSLGLQLEDMVREAEDSTANGGKRASRLALVGLRGAGKSTLGKALARRLGFRFVELNDVIRELSGLPISELFNLYGQDGYRRFEAEALDLVASQRSQVVLAVAGGIVADDSAYETLAQHVPYDLAQGDTGRAHEPGPRARRPAADGGQPGSHGTAAAAACQPDAGLFPRALRVRYFRTGSGGFAGWAARADPLTHPAG
jgi:transcriptional regulator with XRE-family HTH domain